MQVLDKLFPTDGVPPAAAVVGTGGMGKSFLLARVERACAGRGTRVYRWNGHFLEQKNPFGSLDDFVESIGLERSPHERTTRRLILDRLAAEDAVLLVDDAQWIDSDSLRILVGVAERAPSVGIGLIAAHRPSEGEEMAVLDAILSRSRPILQLGPLTAPEVADLVRSILGYKLEPAALEALMVRTEGVPLYIDRVTRAWVEAGVIVGGALVKDPGALPAVAAQIVVTKLAQLEAAARLIVTGLTVGTTLDDELLGLLFGLSVDELRTTVTALRDAGLMSPTRPVLLPLVGEAVDALTPQLTQRDLHLRLAKILVHRGSPATAVAEHLVAAEARGAEVAALLIQAGDQSLIDAPDMALDWYAEAVAAGAEATGIAARRAEAAAASGVLDEAVARADQVVEDPEAGPGDTRRARLVLAGVLPSRGLWRRSADIYEFLSKQEPGAEAFYAVVGLVAAGEIDRARTIFEQSEPALGGTAPLLTQVASLAARGCLETVGEFPLKAMDYLLEAAELLEAGQRVAVLPDTPHALGALAAIAALDFPVAEHLLERAISAAAGGNAYSARHRLLLGWVGLRTGRWAMAQTALDSVARSSAHLSLRDQLVVSALEVGLARRGSDRDRSSSAWKQASFVLRRHPPDLYCSEFVGELMCGSGGEGLAESRVAELEELCSRVGSATFWLLALRWHVLLAAIGSGDHSDVEVRAKSLAALEPATPTGKILVKAGTVWADSLAGRVDASASRASASSLQALGLGWEAARLAGSAATAIDDPALSRSLLESARDLTASLPTAERGPISSMNVLSERELQVAALVVGGLTHKEIGSQLFISPKTVEHHVARIRQRVGAGSRAELLKELRSLLSGG